MTTLSATRSWCSRRDGDDIVVCNGVVRGMVVFDEMVFWCGGYRCAVDIGVGWSGDHIQIHGQSTVQLKKPGRENVVI